MAKVENDFRKKLQYASEIIIKLETMNAGDWESYLDYCENKTADFPDDINYLQAVKTIKKLYQGEKIEGLQFYIKLNETELKIIKIALSNLIGTTSNEELKTATDILFKKVMDGTSLEDQGE